VADTPALEIQGWVGWGSEQPGLVEDGPAHYRVWTRWPLNLIPTQTILWYLTCRDCRPHHCVRPCQVPDRWIRYQRV